MFDTIEKKGSDCLNFYLMCYVQVVCFLRKVDKLNISSQNRSWARVMKANGRVKMLITLISKVTVVGGTAMRINEIFQQ